MAKKRNFKRQPNKDSKNIQTNNIKPPANYDSHKPVFSFKYMPYQKSYCISKCQKDKKSRILDKMLQLSQLTWLQLKNANNKKACFESISRFRFKVAFPPAVTPEVTKILVARYDGDGGRFAGFKINDVFHIVLVGKDLYSH